MAQSDLNVANADGATVRADINSQLEALVTQSAGPTAPPVTFPFMRWMDNSGDPQLLKERNAANTAWRVVAAVVAGELVPYSAGESLDSRYLRQNTTLPIDVFASGTVVQWKQLTSGSYSTTATTAVPMSDGLTLSPKRTDSSLIVEVQYAYECTRNTLRTGAEMQLRYFTGSVYQGVSNTTTPLLSSHSGSGTSATVVRSSGSMLRLLGNSFKRSDTGDWTFRLYGSTVYGDLSETLSMYHVNMILMEVVN